MHYDRNNEKQMAPILNNKTMPHTETDSYTFHSVHLMPGEQIGLHEQSTWEVSYIITGTGTRLIGDTTMPFTSGEVVLIPPEIPHCWYFEGKETDARGRIANITLTFETSFLEKCASIFQELEDTFTRLKKQTDAILFKKEKGAEIIFLLKAMRDQSEAERIPSVIRLIILMADCDTTQIAGRHQKTDKDMKRMQQIHSYVICNYKRDISIDDIAQYTGMNRTSFCSFFKRAAGKTFVNYLNEYRIEITCQLLGQRKMNISEVCYDAGFNDIPYFNRVFKRIKGVSPGKYLPETPSPQNEAPIRPLAVGVD